LDGLARTVWSVGRCHRLALCIGRACSDSARRGRYSSPSCYSAGAMYGSGSLDQCGASDGCQLNRVVILGWRDVVDGLARTVWSVGRVSAQPSCHTRLARRWWTSLLGQCGASDGSTAGAMYWTGLLGQCGASDGAPMRCGSWACSIDVACWMVAMYRTGLLGRCGVTDSSLTLTLK
jgi:hypothetical protein